MDAERNADMQIEMPCAECGEPVFPYEAYPVEITHFDGRDSEIAIFHADHVRMCPLKWATKRLDASGEKLRKMLDIYDEIKASDPRLTNPL